MICSIIVAVDNQNGIGKDNDLLWHLPDDMAFFRQTTMGHPVITGRKNYISIPPKYRPLKGRTNIVLTRSKDFNEDGIHIAHSLNDAIEIAKTFDTEEIFIIGGGQIYREAMQEGICHRLYVTEVDVTLEADTFFPEIGPEWTEENRVHHSADEKHKYTFDFVQYRNSKLSKD